MTAFLYEGLVKTHLTRVSRKQKGLFGMYLKGSDSRGSMQCPVLFCRVPEALLASQSTAVAKNCWDTCLGLFSWIIDRVLTVRVLF